MIECVETGIVYRNPKPHLRAVHAWHPSVARLDNGEMLCSFDLGQAVESLDYRTYLARSGDGGVTWSEPVPLFHDYGRGGGPQPHTTHTARISALHNGELVALGARFYRDDPEEGLTNRANLGLVPMDLILLRSFDRGRTWEGPRVIRPPLVGPGFEVCHPILELPDGRWLAPTATWKGWDGEAPNGMKSVALISHNRGETWPEYVDIFDGYRQGIIYFEVSVTPLKDGRLLAVAWAFEERTGRSHPTPYAMWDGDGNLAPAGGKGRESFAGQAGTHRGQGHRRPAEGVPSLSKDSRSLGAFSTPRPTGLNGQTAKILCLPDGRVLCLYRREDKPGLWANLSRIDGDRWINLAEAAVWEGADGRVRGESDSERLSTLKFGFPTLLALPDGDVYAAFWCCEEEVYNIRWLRIRIQPG